MNTKEVLEELEDIARNLGMPVRYERGLAGAGGMCRLKEEKRIILNALLDSEERVEMLLSILKKENLESVYIRPGIRAMMSD